MFLKNCSISPEEINGFLKEKDTAEINQKIKAINIATRPQVSLEELLEQIGGSGKLSYAGSVRKTEIIEAAEIKIKYSGYLERERGIAEKIMRLEGLKIPEEINYEELASILQREDRNCQNQA